MANSTSREAASRTRKTETAKWTRCEDLHQQSTEMTMVGMMTGNNSCWCLRARWKINRRPILRSKTILLTVYSKNTNRLKNMRISCKIKTRAKKQLWEVQNQFSLKAQMINNLTQIDWTSRVLQIFIYISRRVIRPLRTISDNKYTITLSTSHHTSNQKCRRTWNSWIQGCIICQMRFCKPK